MPPERFPPDDPREWLNRARSDAAAGRGPREANLLCPPVKCAQGGCGGDPCILTTRVPA